MPYLDRYPVDGLSARTLARMSPDARGRVMSRRRTVSRRFDGAGRAPEAIEELALEPVALPSSAAPDPEEWDEAALLETYEQDDGAEDYTDEFGDDDAPPPADYLSAAAPAKPDYSGFIAALRAKERPQPAAPVGPLPEAPSRDGCATCGIPRLQGVRAPIALCSAPAARIPPAGVARMNGPEGRKAERPSRVAARKPSGAEAPRPAFEGATR